MTHRRGGQGRGVTGAERQFNRGKKQEGERALGMGAAGYTLLLSSRKGLSGREIQTNPWAFSKENTKRRKC